MRILAWWTLPVLLTVTQDESCGKCVPCREGTKVMLDILTRITEGKGQPGDIETLESLGNTIKNTALCGLDRLRQILSLVQ